MTQLAGIIVLVGAVAIFLASEILEDLFFAGIIFPRFRAKATFWIRKGVVAIIAGAALVVLGMILLHHVL